MKERSNRGKPRFAVPGIAAALLILIGGTVAAEAGSRGASRSRSKSSVSSQRSSGPRVAVPRGQAAPRSPSRGAIRHRHGGSHRHVRVGVHLGHAYPYWGYWGGWPVYSSVWWGSPWWGGPTAARYVGEPLCAVDLNVKPKSTEVFVDGEYVGVTGQFDGYPGYLWLERGRHELVLHNPGFETEVMEITARGGVVERVKLRLREGETVPPEELMTRAERRAPAAAEVRPRPGPVTAPLPPSGRRDPAPLDLRHEPGRFQLSIEPRDASVYLDGRFLGTGSELASLHSGLIVEPGTHRLEVVRPGYLSHQAELAVEAGREVEVSVELEPE